MVPFLYKHSKKITTGIFLILLLIYSLTWGWAVFNRGNLLGGDFIATYTAIKLVNAGYGHQLYDFETQRHFQHQFVHLTVVPDDLLPYITPPFYVVPFLPLGWLTYDAAFMVVMLVNFILLLVNLRWLRGHLNGVRKYSYGFLILAGLAFFPAFVNLIQGQNAIFTLLIISGSYLLFKQQRDLAAGAILALGLYKPQLMVIWGIILLFKRRWTALLGFSGLALLLVGLSYLVVGWSGMVAYLNLTVLDSPLKDGLYGVKYDSMHNWRAIFRLLLGPHQSAWVNGLTGAATLINLTVLAWAWRGTWQPTAPPFDLQIALTGLTTLLVSPHLNTHDLTLWILIAVLMLNYAHQETAQGKQKRVKGLIIAGSLISFLNFPLQEWVIVPLTTIFMIGVTGLLVLELSTKRSYTNFHSTHN